MRRKLNKTMQCVVLMTVFNTASHFSLEHDNSHARFVEDAIENLEEETEKAHKHRKSKHNHKHLIHS